MLAIIAGLVLGSFLNAWVWRTRHCIGMSGRSVCPACFGMIAWYHNIPVISFIALLGRCRACSQPISLQYLLVESCLPLAFVLVASARGVSAIDTQLLLDWIVVFLLMFVFVYDFKYQLILDRATTIPAIGLFSLSWYFGLQSPVSMLIGAAVGAGFFWLQFVLSKGRWIGGGDIRLGLLMGVVLGWPNILVALFIAYVLGAVVGIGMILLKKKEMQSCTPFGTYLAFSTFLVLLWGERMLEWYMKFL